MIDIIAPMLLILLAIILVLLGPERLAGIGAALGRAGRHRQPPAVPPETVAERRHQG